MIGLVRAQPRYVVERLFAGAALNRKSTFPELVDRSNLSEALDAIEASFMELRPTKSLTGRVRYRAREIVVALIDFVVTLIDFVVGLT
jgi:hypothetical protein